MTDSRKGKEADSNFLGLTRKEYEEANNPGPYQDPGADFMEDVAPIDKKEFDWKERAPGIGDMETMVGDKQAATKEARKKLALEKKASLCLKIAELMLPNGNADVYKKQAVDLMIIPMDNLDRMARRLVYSALAYKLAAEKEEEEEEKKAKCKTTSKKPVSKMKKKPASKKKPIDKVADVEEERMDNLSAFLHEVANSQNFEEKTVEQHMASDDKTAEDERFEEFEEEEVISPELEGVEELEEPKPLPKVEEEELSEEEALSEYLTKEQEGEFGLEGPGVEEEVTKETSVKGFLDKMSNRDVKLSRVKKASGAAISDDELLASAFSDEEDIDVSELFGN